VHHSKIGGQCLRWVIRVGPRSRSASRDVRFAPIATELLRCGAPPLRARSGLMQCSKGAPLFNDLVCEGEQIRRYFKAKGFCDSAIDD
jgi:hypothetical protein